MNHYLKAIIGFCLLHLLLVITIYLLGPSAMGSMWLGIGMMVMYIAIMVGLAIWYRKQLGGYATLKQLFVFLFVVMIVGGIFSGLLNLLLYNVIDPELEAKTKDVMKQAMIERLEKYGMSEDVIEESVNRIDEQEFGSFKALLNSLFGGAIMAAIFGVIISLIFRKNKPEFVDGEEAPVIDSNLNS
ncbi:MAG: DUF4199 domain-containing protein [Bacteroidetes bacterium]|nr:DUF4199 domain-containing protein [Bacteroidota bacterium]